MTAHSRWPITQEIRATIMERVIAIASTSEDSRFALRASAILLAMDRLNAVCEKQSGYRPVLRKFVGDGSKLTAEQVVELLREGVFVDPSQLQHLNNEDMAIIRHELQSLGDTTGGVGALRA